MSHERLLVGNWKMNPGTLEEAKNIAKKTRAAAANCKHTRVVACPPFVYIAPCAPREKEHNFNMGAQFVSLHESGAHTGEVSAGMLKDLGVEYVIVGHSEERAAGDTDALISKRITALLDAGLIPIVCVGEKTRAEDGSHFDFLREQIKNTFADVAKKYAREIILAYEPIWAIGAKEAMKPEEVYEMSLFVKKAFADVFTPESAVKITVLYGGSVNFRNAADIMSIGKVDGLLVGRESVNTPGFVELMKAVDEVPFA
jgi:triosephosphate isomerase